MTADRPPVLERERHPLDVLSLVAGAVFLVIAGLALLDRADVLDVDVRWLWPVALLALGAGTLLASVVDRRRSDAG